MPLIQQQGFHEIVGTNTTDAILSGVMNGVVEEIKGIAARYHSEYAGLKVILTGGDHEFLVNNLKSDIFAVPDLVLHGLNKILDYNGFSE